MKGRRIAALLGVLLAHALILFSLLNLHRRLPKESPEDLSAFSEPITINLSPIPEAAPSPALNAATSAITAVPAEKIQAAPLTRAAAPASSSPAIASAPAAPPERVDWPLEGKKSAARVLAREAEAERIAKLFSGPGGTWASLTKREKSRLKKFRWKPGVDGLEYDSNGNAIYHISDGCVLVNFMFIGCAIGKAQVHGDLFKDMRLYFDEQRLPPTNDGNGTEPESIRDGNAPRAIEGQRGAFDPPPPPEGH